ncbi:MAG: hypothetical protein LBJ37_04145 [Paucimonas sp.]|jgi:tRNA U34 5-carboxymethylaminomethyl modifying GTPase MnmE/TrmE|nr:hypothetical protein [Paucimonas sp.]
MSTVTREALMNAFEGLQKEFESRKHGLAQAHEQFDGLRNGFVRQMSEQTERMTAMISDKNPLRQGAVDMAGRLKKQFDVWQARADKHMRGAEFREGYNDSLLVFVYGKVKSGKSSLGNYVAWGHSEPTAQMKAQAAVKPEYFSHTRTSAASGDAEDEARRNLQFRVGATEATSSIQGFKLPGFTWVDSPGLHSTTAENGDLARAYVEQADLILYTMSSQAPGRASDMGEVGALLEDGRSLMLLLTGSDITDEDETDDGEVITEILMKPVADQRKQIAEVSEGLDEQISVLSLSTRFAELDPANLEASGLGTFFHTLKHLTESQGLKLKLATPLNNLHKGLKETCEDLKLIEELTESFEQQIKAQDKFVERELNTLGQRGVTQMRDHINRLFDGKRPANLQKDLGEKLGQVLGELLGEALQKIGETQQNSLQRAFDTSRLGAIPDYREETEEKEYMSGTRRSTKTAWGAGGMVLGAVIGFAVGGPAGAALGATLGSSARMVGDDAEAIYEKHQVVVGDNLEEQRQAAIKHYANALPGYLEDQVEDLYVPLRDSMQDYCKVLTDEMKRLHTALDTLEKSTMQ